jgi:DNA polymerase-3 subunit delta'
MSYNQLEGQDELRSLLSAAIKSDTLSHAVMLCGPSGSGKTSWGKLLAQAILCPENDGIKPCMTCNSCRSFNSDNHPEFYYLAPDKKKLKTEQFKNVRDRFYLGGAEKVCLIDHAEAMTGETSSSLLKILEDPPDGLTFILLVEQPRAVFDTILSRCRRYHLLPLDCEQIYNLLVANEKAHGEKAELLARLSGGLPGYAFKMAEDEGFDDRFKEAKTLAYNIAIGHDSAVQLLNWAATLAERDDLVLLLDLVVLLYRDALMQNLCRSGDFTLGMEKPAVWTEAVSSEGLEEAVILLNSTVYELVKTNVNRRLLMEKTLIMLQRRLS